jgi:hypothetical protein
MKPSRFICATFALLLFSLSGWAGDKMRANIQIYQTVRIGSTELAPGEYKMTWTQSESNAEVTFSRGKKVIATVPAHVTRERSQYQSPATRTDGVSNTLVAVSLPQLLLSFTNNNTVPVDPGN